MKKAKIKKLKKIVTVKWDLIYSKDFDSEVNEFLSEGYRIAEIKLYDRNVLYARLELWE